MKLCGYDYDKQEWVSDKRAKSVIRKQLQEERQLLLDPNGTGYLKVLGTNITVSQAVAAIDRQLTELK